ncbi:alpha/beta hydrolase, partial [Polaribacter sp. BAL334]|uniref:alpha/beta hydrolase n=1 Tax=Polaribacter sp. BAL334 TaxID=1708178 RepID=UPI0018D22AD9
EINDSKLKLDVYFPSDYKNKTFPAVLLIHGGGWLKGSKENQRIMAQNLALKGYVAIAVSYRLGFEATYPAAINDIKDAIVWVKQHSKKYHINQSKIAVLGASAGAQLATLVGVTPNSGMYSLHPKVSNEIQAIINIDGIVSFIHPNAEEGTMASIWLGGSKESNFNKWKEASPLEYVNENSPPTIF